MSVNYPAIAKNNDNQNAVDVPVDTTAFNNKLSASDIDVQTALETLDDFPLVNQVTTSMTELIDVSSLVQHHYIEQTATPIDTTFTKATGTKISIYNNTAGTNTFDGQDIYTGEGITAIWNGSQWNWL